MRCNAPINENPDLVYLGPTGRIGLRLVRERSKFFAPRIGVGWGFVDASVSTNITHAHEFLRVDRTIAATTMATKSVLISYGENRRVLQVSVDVERVHLLELERRNLCATIANNVCIQHSSNLGI